jgi:hypothetical protein
MIRRHHRITSVIALTLALAASAAPAAWGDPQPLRHAERAFATVPNHAPAITESVRPHPVASGGGFDWGDAGIGAGSAFALTIVALGGALAVTNRRRHSQHQPASADRRPARTATPPTG